MAILSFNGRVNIAIRIVTERYHQAKLYEADGTASGGPTTDPVKIDNMRVVFQNADNTTVMIRETGYGEFGAPVLFPEPWVEDLVIRWPVEMDLERANQLKEAAGYKQPYSAVTLRNPLGPIRSNPSFIFGGDGSGKYIFVDTITGRVTTGD